MNRRFFLTTPVLLGAAFVPLAIPQEQEQPQNRVIHIPPGMKDNDPHGQSGYVGVQVWINGKQYGRVFKYSWKTPVSVTRGIARRLAKLVNAPFDA